jgi:hypothetical protein
MVLASYVDSKVRWAVLVAALVLGGALRFDALSTGFYGDDYQQLAMLEGGFPLRRAAWDAFWFGPHTDAERARLIDFGFDPWWSARQHTIAMFRPLSSVLLWSDLQAFGHDPLGYHLHSFAWWALLITATWALLFRLLPAPAATLALAFFALDESHDTPLCWIANRSTLVAASFGVLALLAQARALERNAPRRLWLAALCWSLALAAGEYAFGMLAYGLAHAWLAPAPAPAPALRVRVVLAAALPAGLYLVIRAALGHGVVASGLYVSPSEPLRYLAVAPARWLALAGELVLNLPAAHLWTGAPLRDELLRAALFTPAQWATLPDWTLLHTLIGGAALALVVLGLRWLARVRAPELPVLRWLLAGSTLALLSAGAALPESRLLVAPELGASAALGVFVLHAWRALGRRRTHAGVALALVAGAVLLVHGPLAARAAYADAHGRKQRALATLRSALRAEIPERAAGIDVVLISTGDFSAAGALPWIRRLHGLPLPRSYRRLSGAFAPHVLRRPDARTLELEVIGDAPGSFAGSLYRPRSASFAPLQRVQLRGMDVQVLAVRGGEVTRFAVRFDRALESPSLLFLHAVSGGLRRLSLPKVGEQELLPRPLAAWE